MSCSWFIFKTLQTTFLWKLFQVSRLVCSFDPMCFSGRIKLLAIQGNERSWQKTWKTSQLQTKSCNIFSQVKKKLLQMEKKDFFLISMHLSFNLMFGWDFLKCTFLMLSFQGRIKRVSKNKGLKHDNFNADYSYHGKFCCVNSNSCLNLGSCQNWEGKGWHAREIK